MTREYLRTLLTPAARQAQQHYYGRSYPGLSATDTAQCDPLGPDELAFVAQRDSFYLATVSPDGWPYVQHRGGPPGFLVAPSPGQLLFADYGGNRQLISTANLTTDARASLFLMDYPGRRRLKILATASILDARTHPELATAAAPPAGHAAPPERVVRLDVRAFDWNCSKFIHERYRRDEIDSLTRPLHERIAALEAQLAALRPS